MNINFYSLWCYPTGNRNRVYRLSNRHSIHSNPDRFIEFHPTVSGMATISSRNLTQLRKGFCTKSRIKQNPEIGQNPEQTKSRIKQNPESNKIPNWTKSRIGPNPESAKSRMHNIPYWINPELDKIPNRTKSRIGQNSELDKIPNRTKSGIGKKSESNQLQK